MNALGETLDGQLTLRQQEQLALILEEHMQRMENGEAVDSAALFAAHPEFAHHLKRYLEGLEFLHRAAGELQTKEPPSCHRRQLGDYELVREVGRGGMGIVYEARQKSLDRRVALKVLPFAAVLDDRQIARFTREAQAAAQLHHPHIVPVYGVGCEAGVHYYSMQLIDGKTVEALLAEFRGVEQPSASAETHDDGRLATRETSRPSAVMHAVTLSTGNNRDRHRRMADLAMQAATALDHAHQYGVVHRDVKPSNLLIDRRGKLWITDFGLARLQSESQVTATGDVVGTLRYMSPEQASGKSALVDGRTDVYSLGATLYEMLALRTPFDDTDRLTLLKRIELEDPTSPRKLDASIPPDLENIVLKALAKNREHRYESCGAFADDLARYLAGKPTLAKRPSNLDWAMKWAARHRTIVIAAALLLLVTTFLTSVSAVLLGRKQQETEAALFKTEQAKQETETALLETRQAMEQIVNSAISLRDSPGAEQARYGLLSRALEYYQQQKNSSVDVADLAEVELRMGQIHEVRGETKEALESFRQAGRLYADLAGATSQANRFRQSLALSLNNAGMMLLELGDPDTAISELQSALRWQQQLVTAAPTEPEYKIDLANTYSNLGECHGPTDSEAAMDCYHHSIELLREVVRQWPDEPLPKDRLAIVHNNASKILVREDTTRAEQFTLEGITLLRELVEAWPDKLEFQRDLALCLNNFANFRQLAKATEEALDAVREAIRYQERLARLAPAVIAIQRELIVSRNNLGRLLFETKDYQSAADAFVAAGKLLQQLIADYPNSVRYRKSLEGVCTNLVSCADRMRRSGHVDLAEQVDQQRTRLQTE